MIPARAAAAQAVAAVLAGQSLDRAVNSARQRVNPDAGSLVQELAYGTVRHWFRLEPVLAGRLRKPFKSRDAVLRTLLVAALYELTQMDTPTHAAVHETVAAAAALERPWAQGLVNGILRGLLREPNALAPSSDDPGQRHGWPDWLAAMIAADWPRQWAETIAPTGLERGPMTLRVNARHGSREAYREQLAAAGMDCRTLAAAPQALTLEQPVAVDALPGFATGAVSIQDAAAQLAAPLLAPLDGLRVLDACAAPGGKTGHLAELGQPAELVAVERDQGRIGRLQDNVRRLAADVRIVGADAAQPDDWWDGRPFDRILLDVPCSGTGVVRRHPDIRLLRRPDDLPALCREQDRLLDAVWPLLATDGMLLYTTCSILLRENTERIEAFLERQPQARVQPIPADWGRSNGPGRQILPGEEGMDGFFYALLVRD